MNAFIQDLRYENRSAGDPRVVGIYAVMAFTVGQRTREISVRVALGAVERQVVAMFVRRGLRVTAIGACVGLGLAVTMAKVMTALRAE